MIEFLTANWLWIVLIVAVIAMHRGGCGSHGNHGGDGREGDHVRPHGPASADRDQHAGHR